MSYDAPGSVNWTATYTGLTPEDVTAALAAESRIMWLGAVPLSALESTIYENGSTIVGGPAPPCTAPLESAPLAVSSPLTVDFGNAPVTIRQRRPVPRMWS